MLGIAHHDTCSRDRSGVGGRGQRTVGSGGVLVASRGVVHDVGQLARLAGEGLLENKLRLVASVASAADVRRVGRLESTRLAVRDASVLQLVDLDARRLLGRADERLLIIQLTNEA